MKRSVTNVINKNTEFYHVYLSSKYSRQNIVSALVIYWDEKGDRII